MLGLPEINQFLFWDAGHSPHQSHLSPSVPVPVTTLDKKETLYHRKPGDMDFKGPLMKPNPQRRSEARVNLDQWESRRSWSRAGEFSLYLPWITQR